MNMPVTTSTNMMVRRDLDFAVNSIPRYWVKQDAFLTRMFDALSLTFPDGERYFIQSVRPFRDKITNPDLQQRVTNFIQQEAQHGIAHDKMNQFLRSQGMPVDQFIDKLRAHFDRMLKQYSPEYNLAVTAASEHLTALMAETFFRYKETLAEVHPYARALFAWHAIEEMEHRDVVFDVMQQVSQVSETQRKVALVTTSIIMVVHSTWRCNIMLKHDGFSALKRLQMFGKGLPWFIGKQGTLSRMRHAYLDWFNQDFHPSQQPMIAQYDVWLDVFAKTQDPIQAGEAFWQAAQDQ